MSVLERLGTSGTAPGAVVVSTICVLAALVLLTRLAGPRSLLLMAGETTGDLSVLTRQSPVDPVLRAGVRGSERLA